MKKIICLSDRLGFRGGAERQLSGLTYFLKQKGYDVQAVTYLKQSHPSVLEMNFGMKYHCLDATNIFSKLFKVGLYIKKNKTDVVIAYKNGPTKICCILKMLGFKFCLIASERNTDQRKDIRVRMKMFLYSFSNYIVPNSYSQEQFIRENFTRLTPKVHTIINYLDAKRFAPQPYENASDVLKCIVVASIKKQKNPVNFIKAISLLKQEGVRVEADWYGIVNDEELYAECDAKIKELNISESIKIVPPVTNIHEMYPNYEMFCLPSYFEGFPNTLCEAMSCGLPVIASNVCDNPYILDNGTYGNLFSPDSPESIANAFKTYLKKNRSNRGEIGRRNRERISSLCAEEAFVSKYIKLIEE